MREMPDWGQPVEIIDTPESVGVDRVVIYSPAAAVPFREEDGEYSRRYKITDAESFAETVRRKARTDNISFYADFRIPMNMDD